MFEFTIDIAATFRHFFLLFGSTAGSFFLVFIFTKPFHGWLIQHRFFKKMREETIDGKKASLFRELHLKKEGTPTMGGILIWGTVLIFVLVSPLFKYLDITRFSLLNRNETFLPIFTLVFTALLGLVDDYLNVRGVRRGVRVKTKFLWLTLFGILGGVWFHFKLGYDLISVPGVGSVQLGAWYILLFAFIVVASANAVNFSDGLDGLAAGLIIIAFFALGIIAYLQGLLILAAFCALVVGATLAFLWFNIPPALFYMGDTGALSLGATLGVIALLTDTVVILPLIGFIFVVETLSIIIQLISKKYFGKKIFRIAPLHHHFEAIGWPESKVVMRFWIVGGFMASLGVIFELLHLVNR
ncbi:MAG: phospho-N-acetylmuramoyl-pentapeptide-transferase [Patescibacteria group bacterium]